MKKWIWSLLCLIACAAVGWQLFRAIGAPNVAHSYSVDFALRGDPREASAVEAELRDVIAGLEEPAEDVELDSVSIDEASGTACFSFRFNRPDTVHSRLWETASGRKLKGVLELWASLREREVYQVHYVYGDIEDVKKNRLRIPQPVLQYPYLPRLKRLLKRSTRPPVSTSFCLPVKNGWHFEQISTRIFFLVERV